MTWMMRSATVVIAVLTGAALAAQPPDAADLLLINGKVFTADAANPWAEAIAIRGDRIGVGTTAVIKQRNAATAHVIDVGGRVVIPGINDAHTHVGARPPGVVIAVNGDDPSLGEVLAAVRTASPSPPGAQWIYGKEQ
jgi:predicted amidohydrolase YtcJ